MSSATYETLTAASVTIGGAIGSSASFLVYTRRDPNKPASTPAAALGDASSLVLNGKGNDSKGKGNAEMTMKGQLTEKDGGTHVDVSMEINISGMLAQFGSRLINDVSNQVFDQFVNNFKSKLSGGEVDNTLNAGSLVGGVIKGIFGKK